MAAAVFGAAAQSGPEELRLTVGKSIVIDYPADISRISTSNPDIVDASPVTTREILIHGKSFGTVTLVVWSKSGQRNFYNITVEQNLEPLRKLLKDTFPAENIHTNTVGQVSTGQFGSTRPDQVDGGAASFTITDALNIFAFRPSLNLASFIKALQGRNLLQILAEPNLVTTSGKEASFLVGGEFPVPVIQGGANSGAVTIMFKEFGVRLTFNPVVLANNAIRMYVKPEVSTLDFTNSVSLNGFTIPALSTRKMETNIELGEGQTFIIAGLIDNRVTDIVNRLPGLASLPIIGNLFKSKDEKKSRTELVVMVTPEITEPLQPGDVKAIPMMPKEFMTPILVPETKTEKRNGKK